jgi:ammonia channel protein AmtB
VPIQIFDGVCWLFLKLRIDDPLSAAPMHGFGGLWGIFFTGLLAKQEYVQQAYGTGMNVSAGVVARLRFEGEKSGPAVQA